MNVVFEYQTTGILSGFFFFHAKKNMMYFTTSEKNYLYYTGTEQQQN